MDRIRLLWKWDQQDGEAGWMWRMRVREGHTGPYVSGMSYLVVVVPSTKTEKIGGRGEMGEM